MPWSSTNQVDAGVLQLVGQVDQMLQRSTLPIEFGDHEPVAFPGGAQRVVQLGLSGELPAGLVDEDPFTAGGGQRVVLRASACWSGRDRPIADLHCPNVSRTGVNVT